MYDLLTEPLLRCATPSGERVLSLPEVFVALQSDTVEGFPGLRAFQEQPWHAFLVQVALAVSDDGVPTSTGAWRDALVAAAGSGAAWELVVDDLSSPAFLQPPVPEGSLATFNPIETADALDVLVTAKNHSVKRARASAASLESWIFALMNLQTTEGFSGRANYGISRMNGGLGSRACFAFAPSLRWGLRWQADLERLRAADADVIDGVTGWHRLTWTLPWDGTTSLGAADLAPDFVEICRRVRLTGPGVRAWMRGSNAPRVSIDDGVLRDPWSLRKEGKPLTLGGSGFDYKKISDLLFGAEWTPGVLARPDASSRWLILRALVRGQGKTEGFHQRTLPLAEATVIELLDETGRERLVDRSRRQLAEAEQARTILRGALRVGWAASGAAREVVGVSKLPPAVDNLTRAAADALDDAVDPVFFDALWTGQSPVDWQRRLRRLGETTLRTFIPRIPVPSPSRRLAAVVAEASFRKQFRTAFPEASDGREPDSTPAPDFARDGERTVPPR